MAKNSKAGGGIRSRVVTERPVRVGQRAEAIKEGGVSQIGTVLGNKATGKAGVLRGAVETVRGAARPSGSPGSFKLGNEVAGNVGKGGPGTGRTLYGKSGSQQQYGSGGPEKPAGRDILSEFGREVPGRGRR